MADIIGAEEDKGSTNIQIYQTPQEPIANNQAINENHEAHKIRRLEAEHDKLK